MFKGELPGPDAEIKILKDKCISDFFLKGTLAGLKVTLTAIGKHLILLTFLNGVQEIFMSFQDMLEENGLPFCI